MGYDYELARRPGWWSWRLVLFGVNGYDAMIKLVVNLSCLSASILKGWSVLLYLCRVHHAVFQFHLIVSKHLMNYSIGPFFHSGSTNLHGSSE